VRVATLPIGAIPGDASGNIASRERCLGLWGSPVYRGVDPDTIEREIRNYAPNMRAGSTALP
jgi:hypothetical protein